jgi:hypothetical protein
MKTRATRRHHLNRIKKKTAKILKENNFPVNPKSIGTTAAVHSAFCSCFMCGNPRKYFDEKTMQEKKSDIDVE